jgi:hypothetical protein
VSKISMIGIAAAMAASIAAPAAAQTRYDGFYDTYSSYSYDPGASWLYSSNHPAATGAGSVGYNDKLNSTDW